METMIETPRVFTYYMPVPGLWPTETQLALIEVWKRSWAMRGWRPVVLTEEDARRHPRYAEFKRKWWELPTEYGHDYEGACFMRWAAVSIMGGGLMVDYDVMNYGFLPCVPSPEKIQLLADRNAPLFAGAVLGPQSLFEGMCHLFSGWVPDSRDWNPNARCFHCSDLTFLQQLLEARNRPCPAWLTWDEGCTLFPKIDGALVHYGYRMRAAGFWPKHQFIETIRPFPV